MEKQTNDSYGVEASEAAEKSNSERAIAVHSFFLQSDGLVGLVAPKEEEMRNLRHVPDKINWSAYRKCSFHLLQPKCL